MAALPVMPSPQSGQGTLAPCGRHMGRWSRRRSAFPSPLVGEGGSARSAETDEGCWQECGVAEVCWINTWSPILERCVSSSTPHPASPSAQPPSPARGEGEKSRVRPRSPDHRRGRSPRRTAGIQFPTPSAASRRRHSMSSRRNSLRGPSKGRRRSSPVPRRWRSA